MTDAPERIWAWDDKTPTDRDKGWSACDAGTGSTEYIRADLHELVGQEVRRLHHDRRMFLTQLRDVRARVEREEAENQRLREALRDFDKADWFWRDLDPDDSGDSAHEAISMLPDFMVSCVCSSFSGPTRYVFRAPVLDSGSDDTEVLHFATESEAIATARARAALRSTREGG